MYKVEKKTRYGVMSVEIIDITPEMAEDMLQRNTNNRKKKTGRIKGYSHDMMKKLWKENGAPIIFDDEGVLRDGQHRLEAIAETGITACNTLIVTVPKSQATCYDIGCTRTLRDISILEGKTEEIYKNTHIINACGEMYRQTYRPLNNETISKLDVIRHIDIYADAFRWAASVFGLSGSKGYSRAGVMGTVIAAYIMGEDVTKLENFVEVLKSGMATCENDRTIITLRNFLLTNKQAGTAGKNETFFKTQRALNAYLEGKILTKIYDTQKSYYLMPKLEG